MEGIGQQILDQKLNDENLTFSSSQMDIDVESVESKDSISTDLVFLLQYLNENQLNEATIISASAENIDTIRKLTAKIISDLKNEGKGPSINLEKDTKYLRIYRAITYALILLQKAGHKIEKESDSEKFEKLRQKFKALQEEKKSLQAKYDNLIQSHGEADSFTDKSSIFEAAKLSLESDNCSLSGRNQQLALELEQARSSLKKSDKLVSYLVSRFGLPQTTDLTNVLSQIKKADKDIDAVSASDDISQILESECFLHKQATDLSNKLFEAQKANEELVLENHRILSELEKYRQQAETAEAELNSVNRLNDELSGQLCKAKIDLTDRTEETENHGAKAFVAETELQVAQLRIKETEEVSQKRKDKIRKLKQTLNQVSEKLRTKEQEFMSLQMQNDKLLIDVDELQTKLKIMDENNFTQSHDNSEEVEKMQTALSELTEQFEQLSNDLHVENETKNKLSCIVQKQNQAMINMESRIKKLTSDNESATTELSKLKEEHNKLTHKYEEYQCDHSEVSNALINFIKKSGRTDELSRGLLVTLSDDKEVTAKVVDAFQKLIGVHGEKPEKQEKTCNFNATEKELYEKNKRLLLYLANLLHFMEQICDSGEVQEWLIGCIQPENFRERLAAQVLKVGSFIKANGLESDDGKLCDTYANFPTFIKTILDESDIFRSEENQELVSLIQQFALANEVISKFAAELQERGVKVMGEVKRMRDELSHVDEIVSEKVDEETHELVCQMQEALQEKEILISKFEKLKSELRKSGDMPSIKCLNILNSSMNFDEEQKGEEEQENEEEDVTEIKETTEDYIAKLEGKIVELQESYDAEKSKSIEEINELNRQLAENLAKVNDLEDSLTEEKEKHEKEQQKKDENIFDLNETKCLLQEEIQALRKDNQNLSDTVAEQKEHIESLATVHQQEIEEAKKACEAEANEKLQELNEKINELDSLIQQKEAESKGTLKKLRQACKQELKKQQQELEASEKRNEEIKQHYEPLLTDLREKLAQARESEDETKEQINRIKNDAKEAKSQLAATRVEAKMLQMKLNTIEEKAKREKTLSESQFNMRMMKCDADHQQAIDEIINNNNNEKRNFLSNICQLFVDFVDFSKPITEESVNELLNAVHEFVETAQKKQSDVKRFNDEIAEIRHILNINETEPLKQSISNTVTKLKEFEKAREKIHAEQEKAMKLTKQMKSTVHSLDNSREWEEWARRIHGVITDNFTVVKDPAQLRYALEEALMSSIGQRQLWRRMDILRMEKSILTNGLVRGPVQVKRNTMTTLLSVVVSLRRMQKLSGHLHSSISIAKQKDIPKQVARTPPSKKRPIISSF